MLTEEALYWIALHKTPVLGRSVFTRLLAAFGTPGRCGSRVGCSHQSARGKVAAGLVARRTCSPPAEGAKVQKAVSCSPRD